MAMIPINLSRHISMGERYPGARVQPLCLAVQRHLCAANAFYGTLAERAGDPERGI